MNDSIQNMRIRFYGVQGSGSTFPDTNELDDIQAVNDCKLLEAVFKDLSEKMPDTHFSKEAVRQYLGGSINRKTLLQYRKKFVIDQPRIYGGWTTCIHVATSDGYDIVFDCGSGFRNCAKNLQKKWGNLTQRELYIFGSHSHYDHTEGFDQAVACFDPRNTIHIHGNYQYLQALNSYLGIFTHHVRKDVIGVQTPINYSLMPASFHGYEICDSTGPEPAHKKKDIGCTPLDINQKIRIGKTTITAFNVCHPAPCLAYKIEHGDKKFIYCTDHELKHGIDPEDSDCIVCNAAEEQLIAHSQKADVLYRDGQFLKSEYDGLTGIGSSGPVLRLDWGHSCIEDVQEMAENCSVKHTYIGHHDPNREWAERNWIDESLARSCKGKKRKIELARAGTVIDL